MTIAIVTQLRFAREEFKRCLFGVDYPEGLIRFKPMNSISWIIGHLANQEHNHWVINAQGENIAPDLNARVGYGKPASTPEMQEMCALWKNVTNKADTYLDTLEEEMLDNHLQIIPGKLHYESIGKTLLRVCYHYWFHTGEAYAIRQQLGHENLPDFVGNMDGVLYSER
ncbi:MAG: DinB family protein [Chloroflexi bacterium]|nr:DinB family protein [Chloroflexota bacterium]MBT3669246.1 DinB family protein [Chloroflexota bacterium]MBT4003071.1 DinB family protein [Chloroflexota bacterium]MBT4305953.1 DinB family protein [Chloroflexota bacterium]MBT4532597.1 DinB family protein [Chloroflexota bacterium]